MAQAAWFWFGRLLGVSLCICSYVCLSLDILMCEYAYTCTCGLSHAQHHNTRLWEAHRGIEASSAMNQVKFSSQSLMGWLPRLLPHSPGALTVLPRSRDQTAPLHVSEPCRLVSSTPHFSRNVPAVFPAVQARC